MSDKKELPIVAGSVVWADSFLMLTRWGNWVSDGVFTLTNDQMELEDFTVIFDAGDPFQEATDE